jgi:mRNA-degrading endonuclease YafQ of YafQ-DinJ toxin-antitoxin module
MAYKLEFQPSFQKTYIKLIKKNPALDERIRKALQLLQENPRYPSLKSHKVETRRYGIRWSSSVTGDIRIIWDFDEHQNLSILILDVGGHSGKHNVYK